MNRTARNYSVDLWGQASGLPTIYTGNYINLNNNEQTIKTNTAPDYGETIHKPAGGKVVEDDKKLQSAREVQYLEEIKSMALRYEKNITNPRENYYGWNKLYNK